MAKYSGIDGQVLFGAADSIEGVADNGATVTVDLADHDFSALNPIFITGASGMTDLNGYHIIASVNAGDITFTLDTAQTYTSGGDVWNTVFITAWSLDVASETKDVTDNTSQGWTERLPSGIKQVSGSFEGLFLDGATRPSHGTAITWYLHMDSSDNFNISGIITGENVALTIGPGDAMKVSYTFEGTATMGESNS